MSTAVHQYSHVKRFHAQGIRHSIAFAHPTKSFGDRQEVYGDRISEIWKSLVSNRHDRRQSTIQSSHSWNRRVTRQRSLRLSSPFQDPLCSPHLGEGARKGALKIACFTLSWLEYRIQWDHHSCGRNNYNLNVATWNVRTLLDNCEQSNRRERRTALVSLELKRFKIDIAALQETRRAGTGQLTEHGGGYTFYWQGRPEGQPRMHGVGAWNARQRFYTNLPQDSRQFHRLSTSVGLH